jgi:micrococcal nuclease
MIHIGNAKNKKIIILVLLLVSCACLHEQFEGLLCVSVYDGDTFELQNGEVVRLIGIDSPEHFEPGGDIARDYLSSLILNKEVVLVQGDQERDDYNRLLRYVYIEGICVNEKMIQKGYAEVRYISEDNPHWEYYIHLEVEAEKEKAGLWKCGVFQPRSLVDWDENISVIEWENAGKYVNQYVIVKGTIVDTYNSGKVCFLNFDPDHYFTVVIFECDFPNFQEPPEVYYLGKNVYIAGIIKEYKGNPEIIVKTPAQIKVLNGS